MSYLDLMVAECKTTQSRCIPERKLVKSCLQRRVQVPLVGTIASSSMNSLSEG